MVTCDDPLGYRVPFQVVNYKSRLGVRPKTVSLKTEGNGDAAVGAPCHVKKTPLYNINLFCLREHAIGQPCTNQDSSTLQCIKKNKSTSIIRFFVETYNYRAMAKKANAITQTDRTSLSLLFRINGDPC